jgi:hypothetical protein
MEESLFDLRMKLRGYHMLYVSQWLEGGRDKLLSDSGIQCLPSTSAVGRGWVMEKHMGEQWWLVRNHVV